MLRCVPSSLDELGRKSELGTCVLRHVMIKKLCSKYIGLRCVSVSNGMVGSLEIKMGCTSN